MTTLSGGDPSRNSRPTIRDVAALARVSLKTVSRVVNGEGSVSDELTARVRRAIEQLDFRPNFTASSLRRKGGRTQTIGLVLEDLANPFSAAVVRAVEDVARHRGVMVLAGSVDEDPMRERALVADFLAHSVDGLIIVPAAADQSYLAPGRRSGTPVVFVDRPPQNLNADVVLAANREGAAVGVDHLIRHGHRRIAFIGDLPAIRTAADRELGYRDAMARHEIAIDETLVCTNVRGVDEAIQVTQRLMERPHPPTALFAAQNLLAPGAYAALRRMGRRADTALVGFDDFPLADLLEPGVTVVAQNPILSGTLAAETLFGRLDGDDGIAVTHVVPTALVQRGSGEIAPRA
jgi:LacI family transcriptional regulator, galactose operon repressor